MLTTDDRTLLRRAFMHGPAAFLEAGLDRQGMADFLQRPEVREEMDLLVREFKHQDIIKGATRYGTYRQISRLGDGAVAVLARGLMGPEYVRDEKDHILRDVRGHPVLQEAEITPIQLRSAESIMECLGMGGRSRGDRNVTVDVDILFKKMEDRGVTIEEDPALETEEQRALSRERVRGVIEVLASHIPEARSRLLKELGLERPKRPKRKRVPLNGRSKSKKKARKVKARA